MGIDGIGKKGPPAPPPPKEAGAPARSGEATRPFDAGKAVPAGSAQPVEASRPALDRFRAGEIDVNGYVDQKVNEATAHLGALPPAQLEQVKASLRERLRTDPSLVDLVRAATGAVPQPPSDD
jgi:hypothetical protein